MRTRTKSKKKGIVKQTSIRRPQGTGKGESNLLTLIKSKTPLLRTRKHLEIMARLLSYFDIPLSRQHDVHVWLKHACTFIAALQKYHLFTRKMKIF